MESTWMVDDPTWMIDHPIWMIHDPIWMIDDPIWMIDDPIWMIDDPTWMIDHPTPTPSNSGSNSHFSIGGVKNSAAYGGVSMARRLRDA
jgi:hypothetical protein